MDVVFLSRRTAALVRRVHKLARQTVGHGFLITLSCGIDQPAHSKRVAPTWAYLNGDLVSCAANSAALDLDYRAHILKGLIKHFDRLGRAPGLDRVRAPYNTRSAIDFLPSCIITLMNLAIVWSPNFGSGSIVLLGTSRRLGIFKALPSSVQ